MKGFRDELDGSTGTPPDGLGTSAYKLGALHAVIGDDVKSVDYLSDEEIVKMIKDK